MPGTPYLIGSASTASGATTITIAVGTATTAGDALIISGAIANLASAIPSGVTDTKGNTYFQANAYNQAGPAYQWVAVTGPGGTGATVALTTTDSITVTYASNNGPHNAIAVGCSGVASVSPVDQVATAAGSSTSPAVATGTQQQSGDVAIALILDVKTGGTPTWGGGWTVQATAQNGSTSYTSVATQTVSGTSAASVTATITSAQWTALVLTLSGGVNAGAAAEADIGFCASATASQGGSGGGSGASVSATITFGAAADLGVSRVNTWSAKATGNYGLLPVTVSSGAGHGLIAFAAWNGATVNPVSNIADDQHNWWIHLGTSSASGDVRCAVWWAPNAQAATNVSLGLTWFAQGVILMVAELSGTPVWSSPDGAAVTGFNNSGTSLTVTGHAAAQGDLLLGVVAGGNNSATPQISASANVNNLGLVTIDDPTGVGGPADTSLTAFWAVSPAGSTPSVTATTTTAIPMAGVLAQLSLSPAAPAQANPNWPGLHYETAFGYQPGDPTQMPAWTDITARVIDEEGSQAISSSRGRQYESESPEAGDLTLNLNNADGALTPGNTGSPYSPDVLLGTATRVWATWNSRYYAVAGGYTERIPQTWPEPQWGIVPWEAPDALDPLSNSTLPSALAGEILTDAPYGYWPMGDTYVQDGAGGLPLANLARTNQRPMIALNGVRLKTSGSYQYSYLQTGLQWQTVTVGQETATTGNLNGIGLTGDPSTGAIGAQGFQDNTATTFAPGAFYAAPDLPQPGTTGLTITFWAIIPGLEFGSHFQELLRACGPAPNYYIGAGGGPNNAYARGARLLIRVNPGPTGTENQDFLAIDLADFEGNDDGWGFTGTITDNNPHHFAFVITKTGSDYFTQAYLDGTRRATRTTTTVNVENDWDYIGIGGVMHNDGGLSYGYNYTMGHVAVFNSPLPASRIAAHYNAGFTGGSNDDTLTRVAKLFTWGGFGLFRACAPASPTPRLGPADQIQGQDVVDAVSTVAQTDGGMFFCDAANNITWWPRTFLYNRPVKWTFGDNPAGGETPYDPGEQYDYDNTFVSNVFTIQQQVNSFSEGPLITAADLPSQDQYFTRDATQQQSIETTSNQDAYDLANWSLTQYKQPALRVEQVVIDPASNPSAWPVALGIEQGDIARLIRRPLGGAVISQLCIVQQVKHDGGPDNWTTTINMVPYTVEGAVLQCDVAGYDVTGSNCVGW